MADDPLIQGSQDDEDEASDEVVQAPGPSPIEVKSKNYASRKFLYAAGTSVLIAAGGVLYAYSEGFRGAYSTMIGGLISALAVFCGAAVTNRHLVSRHVASMTALQQQQVSPALPPRCEPLPPE